MTEQGPDRGAPHVAVDEQDLRFRRLGEGARELPPVLALVREAFARQDDPDRLPSVKLAEYLTATDPEVWGLDKFVADGEDLADDATASKARIKVSNRMVAELKKAVADLGLAVDMSPKQFTGGTRGYALATIQAACGEGDESDTEAV